MAGNPGTPFDLTRADHLAEPHLRRFSEDARARADRLDDAIELWHYTIAARMFLTLAAASLTAAPSQWQRFHSRLHNAGRHRRPGESYAADRGLPPPGAIGRGSAQVFQRSRCAQIYAALPWYFDLAATDLGITGPGVTGPGGLVDDARYAGMTGTPSPMADDSPSAAAGADGLPSLGADVSVEDARTSLTACPPGVLVAGAETILAAVAGRPEPGAPQVPELLDPAVLGKLDAYLHAVDTATDVTDARARRHARACVDAVATAPPPGTPPDLRDPLEWATGPSSPTDTADGAGAPGPGGSGTVPRALGVVVPAIRRYSVPIRIRDGLHTIGPESLGAWSLAGLTEGHDPSWVDGCLRQIQAVTGPAAPTPE